MARTNFPFHSRMYASCASISMWMFHGRIMTQSGLSAIRCCSSTIGILTSRQVLALFRRAPVGHIRQKIVAHTREIEQRIALGSRAIGADLAACLFLLTQKAKKFVFHRLSTGLKP